MAHHYSSRSPQGTTTKARHRWIDPQVTDIIPFDEFGSLGDLDFLDNAAFDTEAHVLRAPEPDDMNDTDNLTPLPLLVPSEFLADPGSQDITDAPARRGLHRKAPVTAGAAKGRLLFAAMAAGAAAAAAHSAAQTADARSSTAVLAAERSTIDGASFESSNSGVQLVTVTPAASYASHTEELANGAAFAQERADREARLQQPLYVAPTRGIPTSGYGYRWGVLHGGIDIANSIGTPIVAVSDGIVIDAGPTAGYGAWVKLRHADGTVTLYGHVNTINCNVGQRVMAGDQIATIGNRGNSTGPHLHFEVLLNGTDRIDPVAWLANRGISIGGISG